MIARSLELARETGSPLTAGFTALRRAQVADMRGEAEMAAAAYDEAIALGVQLGDRTLLDLARIDRVRHCIARDDFEAARRAIDEASGSKPAWLVALMRALVLSTPGAELPPMPERASFIHRVLGHLCTYRRTRDVAHLRAARELIDAACSHFDAEGWARFWRFSPIGRFDRAMER